MTHGDEAKMLVAAFNRASPGAKALFVHQFIVEIIAGVRDEERLRWRVAVIVEAIHQGLTRAGTDPVKFLINLVPGGPQA